MFGGKGSSSTTFSSSSQTTSLSSSSIYSKRRKKRTKCTIDAPKTTAAKRSSSELSSLANEQTSLALKEWKKVETALARGEQTVLLRKGAGIVAKDDDGDEKRFELKSKTFFLFPTTYHMDGEAKAPRDESEIPFSLLLRCTRAWETNDTSVIATLSKFHCLKREEALKRLNYKPKEPFLILEVRAYALPQDNEYVLPPDVKAKYGGCRSWVDDLPFEIPDTSTLNPILDQRDWLTKQSDLSRKIDYMKATGIDVSDVAL